jgi:hypothetical protein
MENETFNVTFRVNSIFEETNVPFPDKDTELFVIGNDWSSAHVEQDWESYIRGYMQAANLLVEYVGQSGGLDSDTLVFPIVFMYRQHLELRIKDLRLIAQELLNKPNTMKQNHDIVELWEECSLVLKQIFNDQYLEEFETIKRIIDQFSRIDPTSQGFRYPIDKKGKPSFPEEFRHVNLGHLSKTLSGIAVFFSNLEISISYRLGREE